MRGTPATRARWFNKRLPRKCLSQQVFCLWRVRHIPCPLCGAPTCTGYPSYPFLQHFIIIKTDQNHRFISMSAAFQCNRPFNHHFLRTWIFVIFLIYKQRPVNCNLRPVFNPFSIHPSLIGVRYSIFPPFSPRPGTASPGESHNPCIKYNVFSIWQALRRAGAPLYAASSYF